MRWGSWVIPFKGVYREGLLGNPVLKVYNYMRRGSWIIPFEVFMRRGSWIIPFEVFYEAGKLDNPV